MTRFNDRESGKGDVRPFSMHSDRIGGESRLFLDPGAEGGGQAAGGEGGEGGDNNTQGNPPGGGNGEHYTKEQMENYMNSHLAKARKSWERDKENIEKNLYTKLGISGPDEIERLAQIREEAEKAEQRKQEEKGQFDKILADKEKKWQQREADLIKERDTERNDRLDLIKENQLTNMALKAGADQSNVDMIVAFTKGNVKVVDKNTIVPVDQNGDIPLNPDTGKDLTLEEYMRSFLSARPGLVKAAPGTGGGTGVVRRTGDYTIEDIKKIAQTDLQKFKELEKDGTVKRVMDAAGGSG